MWAIIIAAAIFLIRSIITIIWAINFIILKVLTHFAIIITLFNITIPIIIKNF